MENFICNLGILFGGLIAAGLFSRLAFAISEKITRAPLLDVFVSLFTWIPWVAGAWLDAWWGVLAALVAQFFAIHAFCLTDRLLRGKNGRTLTDAQNHLLGPLRNQLALFATVPAVLVFIFARLTEIFVYPVVAWLAKMPTYRQGDWVNLSRHKYAGLIGYDLLWCWYCDWMTGLWALGLSPYHHGMRMRMGLAGRPPQVMDLCLGRDRELFPKVLVVVLKRLDALDEDSTPEAVDAVFPWAGTRPDMARHLSELFAAVRVKPV